MITGVIKSIRNPFGDYYIINITTEEKIQWIPGQYGIFKLEEAIEGDKNQRIFSFASIVEENEIILGTRTGPSISKYKNVFLNLKPGAQIAIKGAMGKFTLRDDNDPIVMIAGGVGITPIRSIFKELEKENSRDVELVFSSMDHYLFFDDLKAVAENDQKILVHAVSDPESTQEKIKEMTDKYRNGALYYISGSPGLIKAIKALLLDENIDEGRIIFDSFTGY